jgi:hypothetical protein
MWKWIWIILKFFGKKLVAFVFRVSLDEMKTKVLGYLNRIWTILQASGVSVIRLDELKTKVFGFLKSIWTNPLKFFFWTFIIVASVILLFGAVKDSIWSLFSGFISIILILLPLIKEVFATLLDLIVRTLTILTFNVIQLTLNSIILLLGLPLKGFFWIIQSLFPLMVVGLIICFAQTLLIS